MVLPRTPTKDKAKNTNPEQDKIEASGSSTEPLKVKTGIPDIKIPKRLRSNSTDEQSFYEINNKNKPEKVIQESLDRKIAREKLADLNRSFNKESQEEDKDLQFFDSSEVQENLKQDQFIPKLNIFKDIPATEPHSGESGAKSKEFQQQEHTDSAYDTLLGDKTSFDHEKTNLGGSTGEGSKHPPTPPRNSPPGSSRQSSVEEEEMANQGITFRDILAYKIKFFDGVEKELDGFINTCEMYNGMTPDELKPSLLTLVKARITGEALSKVQPIEGFATLPNLLLSLKNAIRKPLSYELASERLNNLFQKSDETVEKYAHNIREALQKLNESSSKVSDNVEERSVFRKAHEKLAVAKFIQNLNSSELRVSVAAANKTTLEECITYALERELTEKSSKLRICSVCNSFEHKIDDCPLKKEKDKQNVAIIRPQNNQSSNAQFLNNYFRNRFPRSQQPFRSNFQPNFQLSRGSTPFRSYFPSNNANTNSFRPRFNNFTPMQPNTANRDFLRNERQFSNRNNGIGNNPNNGNSNVNTNNGNGNFSRNTPNANTQPQGFNRNNYNNNRNYSNNRFANSNRNARTVSFVDDCPEDEEFLSALLEAESLEEDDRKN